MKITLPREQLRKLTVALEQAGRAEIGGQLYGEQLAPSLFRITDVTVQRRRGAFASFVVDVIEAGRAALAFFSRTRHDYARHNYIGEWHSHPSFAVSPSSTDAQTMRDLVGDQDFAGTFAVLMIVRLDGTELRTGAWLYDPRGHEQTVTMEIENDGT